MEKLLFRPGEAAEVLGLSRTKVYDLIARGELPSVRVGHSIRVRAADLSSWLQDLRRDDSEADPSGSGRD
jgi:putative molybdopterin biosynthesis protein